MKKNLLYLAVFVSLLILAIWLVKRDRNRTLDPTETSFKVADTAAVQRIFMADRQGGSVLLERTPAGNWLVNGKYVARPDMMNVLLETFIRMEVKSPVPKGAMKAVKTNIATTGIKVEIYSGPQAKKELVYYVGSSTVDTRGTYMIKEDADLPYILYIPGWEGYLTPRFFTSQEAWRERVLFRLSPEAVQSIAIQYPDTPAYNFSIERVSDSSYRLQTATKAEWQPFSSTAAAAIWKDLSLLRVEGFENEVPIRDSVITMVPPIFKLIITQKSGKKHTLSTYFKSQLNTIDVVLIQGFPDLDRSYFYYEEGDEFGVIQRMNAPWLFLKGTEIVERTQ
jgi:hypothetical protein